MKIAVKNLLPNPFRNLDQYPIDREKVDSLKASIKETTFWDNILARKAKNGSFEISYGHHRLVALKELKIKEVDIPVRPLDDGMMIKIMANENRDVYKQDRAVVLETVRVTREWLREEMKKDWETSDGSVKCLFSSERGFAESKTKGVGRGLIRSFLGGDWKEWEIREALAQLDDDTVTPEALEQFDTLSTAQAARKALKEHKIPKSSQKAITKMLVADEVPVKQFNSVVAEISYKRKKEEEFRFPALPPMLDERIEEAVKDIGILDTKLRKITGYLSHVQNRRLTHSLETYGKLLRDDMDKVLHELYELRTR